MRTSKTEVLAVKKSEIIQLLPAVLFERNVAEQVAILTITVPIGYKCVKIAKLSVILLERVKIRAILTVLIKYNELKQRLKMSV